MFETYTAKARRVIFFARYEASQYGSPHIGAEHILLGLLREDRSLMRRVFGSHTTVEAVRRKIDDRVPRGKQSPTSVDLPLSEESKRILAYASDEAQQLEHKNIDTHHLFVALLREQKSFAAEVLQGLGLDLDGVRDNISQTIPAPGTEPDPRPGTRRELEPRWPAFIAMAADALIHFALPDRFSVGPRWALFAVIMVLLVPIIFTHRFGRTNLARILTFVAIGVLALSLVTSLALLIAGLPSHKDPPKTLLISATLLWMTNVLVFALSYWKLDAGGPLGRQRGDARSSFLFPQMAMQSDQRDSAWSPEFVDYLFLAFNTSTAFSPTDTAVLSRWAKGLMMLQSTISLLVIALLAARAINVL
jgi:hypothetical protein